MIMHASKTVVVGIDVDNRRIAVLYPFMWLLNLLEGFMMDLGWKALKETAGTALSMSANLWS
jgi:hypothetical protein